MALNWKLYIICQDQTKEELRCPQNAHSFNPDDYKSFLNNVRAFKNLDCLPVDISFDLEETTVEIMIANRAKWHRSCHLKFKSSKLKKAEERSRRASSDTPQNLPLDAIKRPRARSTANPSAEEKCIICDKDGDTQPRTQGTFGNESTLVDRGHVVLLYCPDFGQ